MDVSYLWPNLKLGLTLILDMLLVLVILTGIRVYQARLTNRLLKSIEESLRIVPGRNAATANKYGAGRY